MGTISLQSLRLAPFFQKHMMVYTSQGKDHIIYASRTKGLLNGDLNTCELLEADDIYGQKACFVPITLVSNATNELAA